MKSKIIILPLLALMVISYQNCGGNLSAISSDRWSVGNGPTNEYLDGLPPGISQSGQVFARDPATDSGNQSLALSTDLSGAGRSKTITHLKDFTYLSNGIISFNLESMYPGQFASARAPLVFPPTNPKFQQVNAYDHIDTLIADLAGMSMFPSSYTPIKIDAHCSDAEDNAYYSYEDHELCLGYTDVSSKRVWAADDLDVTIHEFGHSLNHTYSTTEILTSTPDLGAIDEGFADLWSYRQTLDPKISVWFGRGIYASAGQTRAALRNLSTVTSYPSGLKDEVHDDSSFISGAVYAIESGAGLGTVGKTRLEKRMLESLQFGHGLQDAIVALKDEAADLGVSSSLVSSALSARGLWRKDLVSEVRLNTTKPFYIVDNHALDSYLSVPSNGDCSGTLDNGEVAILYPDLENTGAIKGGIATELVSNSPNVTVVSGASQGFFYRLKASNSFRVGELGGLSHVEGNTTYDTYLSRVLPPSFIVRATGTGVVNLTMRVTMMDTQTDNPQTQTYPISFTIGSNPNQSSCTTDVWP